MSDFPTDRETAEALAAELSAVGHTHYDILPLRAAGTLRAMMGRIEELEARAETAEAEVERLRPWALLGNAVVSDWPDIREVDGFELEALAEEHGVLYRAPGGYDPERHHDYFSIGPEPGEEWFEMIEPPRAALRRGEDG